MDTTCKVDPERLAGKFTRCLFTTLLIITLGWWYSLEKKGQQSKCVLILKWDWNNCCAFVLWVKESFIQRLSVFLWFFLGDKKINKAFLACIFILCWLNFSDQPSYGLESRKRYTLSLLFMCLGRDEFLKLFFLEGSKWLSCG